MKLPCELLNTMRLGLVPVPVVVMVPVTSAAEFGVCTTRFIERVELFS